MKWLVYLILLALVIPVSVVTFNVGYNLADDKWEYKTQYLQEQLDACQLRDKFEGLRHNASNGKLGPQTEPK